MTDRNVRTVERDEQCQELRVENADEKDPVWMSGARMTFAEAEACYLHAKSRLHAARQDGPAAVLEYRAARAEIRRLLEVLWPGAIGDTTPDCGRADAY